MSLINVATLLVLAMPLAACSPQPAATTASSAASAAPDRGERIYNANCVPCHQQNGAGIASVYPSLAASPVVQGDPAELARWVLKGQRPLSMPLGRYSTQMLQFGWMQPADAALLFTYLRSNFGNSASPVDAATVIQAIGK
jgi:mono/diheme cytochrome c family protein